MTNSFAAPPKRGRQGGGGSKPKPATVADFVSQALSQPLLPPPPAAPKPRSGGAGIWDTMNPAERTAYAKAMAARRDPKNMSRTKRRTGTPSGWNHRAVSVARATALLEATELAMKLKTQGVIPPNDPEGEAATIAALAVLRSPGSQVRKVAQARKLLRFYHPDMAGAA